MRNQPAGCGGCPLSGNSRGFMAPSLGGLTTPHYGVALVGDQLSDDDVEAGAPFKGAAGFKLTRLLQWAGFERSGFDIYNAAWCQPPSSLLDTPLEHDAVAHCRSAHWGRLVTVRNPAVVVPMGNLPLRAFLPNRQGILAARGYTYPSGLGYHIVPTVPPSMLVGSWAKYAAAFINDIRKAVKLAREGIPIYPRNYTIDPTPIEAYRWAQAYRSVLAADPRVRVAYDIETPGKKEDEGDSEAGSDPNLNDRTYHIFRIGFSYQPYSALTVPWTPPYIPAIKLILESEGDKVVWNKGFDNPRIEAKGVQIKGQVHDGMIAWHVLQSDLPKGLGFVATFMCPDQEAW